MRACKNCGKKCKRLYYAMRRKSPEYCRNCATLVKHFETAMILRRKGLA